MDEPIDEHTKFCELANINCKAFLNTIAASELLVARPKNDGTYGQFTFLCFEEVFESNL